MLTVDLSKNCGCVHAWRAQRRAQLARAVSRNPRQGLQGVRGRHRGAREGEHVAQAAPHPHLHQGHACAAAAHPLMSVLLRLAPRDGGGAVPGVALRGKGLGS